MFQFRAIDSACRTSGVAAILLLVFDVEISAVFSFILIGVSLGVAFEGLGLNFSRISHAIPDMKILIRYFMRLMFFVGPILYPLTFAEGVHYRINLINPFTYFVELSRYLAGLDSSLVELDPYLGIFVIGFLVILGLRGYSKIDALRWELSAWS